MCAFYGCDFINVLSIMCCKFMLTRIKVNGYITFLKLAFASILGGYALRFNYNHNCDFFDI